MVGYFFIKKILEQTFKKDISGFNISIYISKISNSYGRILVIHFSKEKEHKYYWAIEDFNVYLFNKKDYEKIDVELFRELTRFCELVYICNTEREVSKIKLGGKFFTKQELNNFQEELL